MRRPFALALASLTLGTVSLGLFAQGCNGSPLGVQDLCGWIADGCNCYRLFAAGVADVTVERDAAGNITSATGQPKCGVTLDSNDNALDPTTGAAITDETAKPTFGTFGTREKLDICVLQGAQGGQVVFDPPLDVTVFPPTGFSFKIVQGSGEVCGTGSFNSTTSFSIGFPAADGAGGGGGGTGGAGGAGGGTTEPPACRGVDTNPDDGKPAPTDPDKSPITSGTFTMSGTDQESVVDTVCPNGEVHKFNLYQLNKCDGTSGNEAYKALLPAAEIDAKAGGANQDGYVRFRVFWPPTEANTSLDGQKPIAVEYFHCTIPAAPFPCFDEALSDGETDVDCGGVCTQGCEDEKNCLVGSDCISKVCEANAAGLLKCVTPPCGDGDKTGTETCDDGNTADGDGCSAICRVETGYTCTGEGIGSCTEDDECALMTDNCPVGTTCANLPGTFTCLCEPGFAWDGMECVAGCGDGDLQAPEACDDSNTNKGDGCTENCLQESGYFCMGEGPGSCVNIDECATMMDTCLDTEICDDNDGSFTCICKPNVSKVCEGVCIDISSDVFNCGDCDNVCIPNQGCFKGQCCTIPNNDFCDNQCVNTQTDVNHCGACDKPCAGTCAGGVCCLNPNTVCGSMCVDLQSNESHCGACDAACPGGGTCHEGDCCNPPSAVCDGACVDTLTNNSHCGACDTVCMGPDTCQSGVCCSDPNTVCGNACVDTQTNPAHCGDCGIACGAGQTCVAGACTP
jgi:cysteine-rich repeat protein